MAARRGGQEDPDHIPLAAHLHLAHDGRDGVERAADPRLQGRRPGRGDRPGRAPATAPRARQEPRRHMGRRPGSAGVRRRDDPQLPRPGERLQHDDHGGHEPGCGQAVALRTGEHGRERGSRRSSLRRPGSGIAGSQRKDRHRVAQPSQGRHHRGRDDRGVDPPRDAQHGVRLARERRDRPLDRQGRHLGRGRHGDLPQRQPQGEPEACRTRLPRRVRSAAASPRWSRTPVCRRPSRAT